MVSTLGNLARRRRLLWELVLTEFRSLSSESRLGIVWWLLDPIIMMAIYYVFIVVIFGRDRYPPYPVFVGCGLLAWKHLSGSLAKAANVLTRHEAIIKSVPFPTMILPLSVVASEFVNFVAGFLALMGLAFFFGLPPFVQLAHVPALMLCQLAVVTGVTLVVTSFGAMVRDLAAMLVHVMRIGWYLSPGVYGLDLVNQRFGGAEVPGLGVSLSELVLLNPFAVLFTGYRGAVHTPEWLSPRLWAMLTVEALLLLVLGFATYRYFERRVIKFI